MMKSETIGNFNVDDNGYITPVTGDARVAWRERNETEAQYHLKQADGHLDEALRYIIAIKLNKLYDGNWEDYVKRVFGTSRQNIERHIAHAETLEIIRSTTGALLSDLPEGAARPINALDTALRPLAYQIAAGVAERAGHRITVTEARAAADAVTRMVTTGDLNADESAHEYRAANITAHSRWRVENTAEGSLSVILRALHSIYETSPATSVRAVFYVPSDDAPSGYRDL